MQTVPPLQKPLQHSILVQIGVIYNYNAFVHKKLTNEAVFGFFGTHQFTFPSSLVVWSQLPQPSQRHARYCNLTPADLKGLGCEKKQAQACSKPKRVISTGEGNPRPGLGLKWDDPIMILQWPSKGIVETSMLETFKYTGRALPNKTCIGSLRDTLWQPLGQSSNSHVNLHDWAATIW